MALPLPAVHLATDLTVQASPARVLLQRPSMNRVRIIRAALLLVWDEAPHIALLGTWLRVPRSEEVAAQLDQPLPAAPAMIDWQWPLAAPAVFSSQVDGFLIATGDGTVDVMPPFRMDVAPATWSVLFTPRS